MLKTRIEHAQSQVRRRRRRGLSRDWRKFGEKWRGSKAAALGANLVGAIGCILGNKHVMTHGARAPLFLTFMGYLLIVLYHQLQRTRNIGIAPVFDVEGAQLPPYRPPRKVVVALVLLTATAPSLANASLMFNSVGFTQLSKVLTTPSIAFIERARGHGHPLDAPRLLSMVFIHVGVYVASVADVTLNRTGCLVALANVCVTARYKTAWSSASRDAIARFVAASFFCFGRLASTASPRGSRRRRTTRLSRRRSHRACSQAARDARGARGRADARARRARGRAGARRAHAPVGRRRAHTVYCIFRVGRAAEHGRDVRRDGLRAALLHRGPPRRPFSFPRFGLRRRRHRATRVASVTARPREKFYAHHYAIAATPSPRYATQVLGAWTSATGYMVIGRLSALTHQVLGQFKMACLLLGSYVVLGADLNRQQLGGASLTMASIVLYTRCTLAQRRRLEARRRGDEPLGRSPSEDPLLSPGRRRKVANGHSSSSRRMPGVLSASSSRSSRPAGLAVV